VKDTLLKPQRTPTEPRLRSPVGNSSIAGDAAAEAAWRAAREVQVCAAWVTLIASWVTLIASWVTLIASWVTSYRFLGDSYRFLGDLLSLPG
jgi:hypothetical protein